ncbi:MAG: phytanoyl-CoA dioxygenase family protein, partial [Gemmatimonadetes bacterium]|nr:phytanoyl-CoA dioxygenase family protein [Gemmatimonadota bacterium]
MNPNHIGAEEVEFFQENGFLRIPGFFSKREIAELADALDKTVEEKRARILGGGGETDDDYNRVFNQMVNLWVDYEVIRKYSFDARLAEIARKISKCKRLVIYHDHGLIKPGGEQSKATNWHQDAPYWPMEQVGA